MANLTTQQAKILTFVGALQIVVAAVMLISLLLGYGSVPITLPLLMIVGGIALIVVSLSYHTKK